MKTIKHFILGIILGITSQVYAQWNQQSQVPSIYFSQLYTDTNRLFAISDSNLVFYTSTGQNWNVSVLPAHLVASSFISFKGSWFVGTQKHGIWMSVNQESDWQYLGLTNTVIHQFMVHNDTLYAATDLGVAYYAVNQQGWIMLTNGMPTYAKAVVAVASNQNRIIAEAGANGAYYTLDKGSVLWNEYLYYNRIMPGLQMTGLLMDGETAYAVNGRRVLHSVDEGITWKEDHAGLGTGFHRLIKRIGAVDIVVTNTISYQATCSIRSTEDSLGVSWQALTHQPPLGYVSDVCLWNNNLWMATEYGILKQEQPFTSIPDLTKRTTHISVYPNPSSIQDLTIQSDKPIRFITITDFNGKVVFANNNAHWMANRPELPEGLYMLLIETYSGEKVWLKWSCCSAQ